MLPRVALLVLLLLGTANHALAEGPGRGPLGVGVLLGEPTALTAKLMLNDYNGVQVHLGYGIGKRGRFILVVDYLFHIHNALPAIPPGFLTPYVGVGGRLGVWKESDAVIGVVFPLGLSLFLNAAPVEIFLEIAPGIGLLPGTAVLIDGGLGGRFYF